MTQLEAMLLSFAIEVPVALVIARVARGERQDLVMKTLVAALLATTITHPLVWHFNHSLVELAPWPRLALLEVGAFAIEGLVYFAVARTSPLLAWGTSLAANATSFGIGLVIFALLR